MSHLVNTHEDLNTIGIFGEYRCVMKKVMAVIKEAYNVERKRRHTARKKTREETMARKRQAKELIVIVKRGGTSKDEIERRLDEIFDRGRRQEIEETRTDEKIAERIEKISKRVSV